MRNVTIHREKSFVACLGKLKVYIEDPNGKDIVINGVPCTKVGVLKNGKTLTFQVDESSRKVFVIAGKTSASFCSDYYQLPAGTEDVNLSGRNKYNLANGNAFRFNGVTDEEVLNSRKKGTRKGIIILIFAVILGVIIGLLTPSFKKPEDKQFSVAGMNITLTDEFEQIADDERDIAIGSDYTKIYGWQEDRSLFEEGTSLNGYMDLLKIANEQENIKTQTKDGLVFCEYDADSVNGTEQHHHYLFVYETDDSFWTVQFIIRAGSEDKIEEDVFKWAKSVSF